MNTKSKQLLALSCVFLWAGCSAKVSTTQFLAKEHVLGLEQMPLLHQSSESALNGDYRNQVYFASFQCSTNEFQNFIVTNSLVNEHTLGIPLKNSTWPKPIPSWWNIPSTPVDLYSKHSGNSFVVVCFDKDQMFLFGSD